MDDESQLFYPKVLICTFADNPVYAGRSWSIIGTESSYIVEHGWLKDQLKEYCITGHNV